MEREAGKPKRASYDPIPLKTAPVTTREVYKVVISENGILKSYNGVNPIHYKPKTWTLPPEGDGPLAAFETLDQAKRFVWLYSRHYGTEIWVAEAEALDIDPKTLPPSTPVLWGYDPFIWPYNYVLRAQEIPAGTVLCRSIKLSYIVATSQEIRNKVNY